MNSLPHGAPEKTRLNIGFIALTDCASIVMAQELGLFRKHGAATIVDFNILDQILEAAPPAEFPEPAA